MDNRPNYIFDRTLFDSLIGRTDLSVQKKHKNAQQYAEALMTLATQTVDSEQSGQTIQNHVLKMITPSGLTSSGILLTENGFFVTTYHSIRGFEPIFAQNCTKAITKHTVSDFLCENAGYVVLDQNNNLYSLDPSFLFTDSIHDLALLKVLMPGKIKALPYNISNRPVEKDESLLLVGMKSGLYVGEARIIVDNPKVTSKKCGQTGPTLDDLFWAEGYTEPGYSGGAIIDQSGSLHGIIKARFDKKNQLYLIGIPSIYLSYLVGRASHHFAAIAENKN